MNTNIAFTILNNSVLDSISTFFGNYLPIILGIAVALIAFYFGLKKFLRMMSDRNWNKHFWY